MQPLRGGHGQCAGPPGLGVGAGGWEFPVATTNRILFPLQVPTHRVTRCARSCPYYRYAEDGLYGRIPGVGIADTTYWAALAQVTNITDPDIASVLSVRASPAGLAGRAGCGMPGEG